MMRSLYSGVSGLKVHQTKMDVIGNNIANVNTIGFKASTVQFSDIFYQTTQNASGANELTGTAGTNAKQIGLGTSLASITAAMTTQGGSQRTDNATDLMITGNSFFIVNNGNGNYFTKNGSFTIDGAGYLATETGYYVMGWSTDPDDPNKIKQDTVGKIAIQTPENASTPPEATSDCTLKGNIDKTDSTLAGDGYIISSEFYDNLGNAYTAKIALNSTTSTATEQKYTMNLLDITSNATGKSVVQDTSLINSIQFGGSTYTYDATTKQLKTTGTAPTVSFNPVTGAFMTTTATGAAAGTTTNTLDLVLKTASDVAAAPTATPPVEGSSLFGKEGTIKYDCSSITQYSTTGACSISSSRGSLANTGAGRKVGNLSGVIVQQDGKIYGSYDNSTTKLLGQIAVASFSNPAGLEAIGGSLFAATQNSGDFDGKGVDVTADGGKFSTGVLEMSNVDLSSEFTNMITTQRGFQANSRIITTSDTLLEELINLKR
ncbi:flagellar hook protein FlgE [Anaerosporobacter faecicola]|uniref:flagellar hook protein FlgE n=1 Tax=Anaerosporobacter faecicola TaxID=2718714 RepID=UPI00143CBB52|nr:flagellar hook-basal body complex protein [Anaerosporobacter faecicola]